MFVIKDLMNILSMKCFSFSYFVGLNNHQFKYGKSLNSSVINELLNFLSVYGLLNASKNSGFNTAV